MGTPVDMEDPRADFGSGRKCEVRSISVLEADCAYTRPESETEAPKEKEEEDEDWFCIAMAATSVLVDERVALAAVNAAVAAEEVTVRGTS